MKTLTFEEVKANVKETYADWKNQNTDGDYDPEKDDEVKEINKCEDLNQLIQFFYFIDFENPEEFIFDCIIDG